MHGFWHCQTVTPIENSKQNPARTHARMHAASDKQSKPSTQTSKPKNNGQGFALVSDTKKQRKNPALGWVSFSGFA
jgi:hypothetical protein